MNQLLIVASLSVSLAARKDISQATYAIFFLIRHVWYHISLELSKITLRLLLHETIRNDGFQHHTALQGWNKVVTIRNNVATLCCAKSRRCESSRVTLPLR